jgi:hypothetical protein
LIIRNGRLLLDACFYPYDCTAVHDMASVTKSAHDHPHRHRRRSGQTQLDQPDLILSGRTIANLDPAKNISPSATWPAC